MQMESALSVDRVLRGSWRTFRARFWRLVGTTALLALACLVIAGVFLLVLAAVPGSLRVGAGLVVGALSLVGLVAALAAYAGSVVRIVETGSQGSGPGSVSEVLRSLKGRLWKIAWVTAVAWVAILVGLILFIVPGVVLAILWSVYLPVIVVEGLALDSLARSRELVRGNALGVLGTHFVFAALLYVAMILVVVVVFLLMLLFGAIAGSDAAGAAGVVIQVLLPLATTPLGLVVGATIYFELAGVERSRGGSAALPTPQV